MEWAEYVRQFIWCGVGLMVGQTIYDVHVWLRAKAVRELAQAKMYLCDSVGRAEADKVKLP